MQHKYGLIFLILISSLICKGQFDEVFKNYNFSFDSMNVHSQSEILREKLKTHIFCNYSNCRLGENQTEGDIDPQIVRQYNIRTVNIYLHLDSIMIRKLCRDLAYKRSFANSEDTIVKLTSFRYDSLGNVLERINFVDNSKRINCYRFEPNGDIICSYNYRDSTHKSDITDEMTIWEKVNGIEYYPNGFIKRIHGNYLESYFYDSNGNLVLVDFERNKMAGCGRGGLKEKWLGKYNQKNQLIYSLTKYDSFSYFEFYCYDSFDKLVSINSINSIGKKWIEMFQFNGDTLNIYK